MLLKTNRPFRFFFFFSTFDMDKFGKICRHHLKERLKISKITKFKSDLLQGNKDTDSQSRHILQTFMSCPPPYKR